MVKSCHEARQKALGPSGIAAPGAYVPKCNSDGSYSEIQCHISTGHCWCVDENGLMQHGTKIRGKPTCGKPGESVVDTD